MEFNPYRYKEIDGNSIVVGNTDDTTCHGKFGDAGREALTDPL